MILDESHNLRTQSLQGHIRVHNKVSRPDTELPRFSDDVLASYVQSCMQNQEVVTVNIGVYQDASIGPQAQQLMRSVRRKIRGS
jgi:hypothetical protein